MWPLKLEGGNTNMFMKIFMINIQETLTSYCSRSVDLEYFFLKNKDKLSDDIIDKSDKQKDIL